MTEYKPYKDKYAICIDWETSGSDWKGDSSLTYQGISFGAVIFDTKTFEPIETLYREIKFDETKYKWSTEAEKIHGLSRDHLEANGVTREQAAIDLASLITKYFDPQWNVLFLGHNREFDVRFTEQLLKPFEIMFKVSHTVLDTSGVGYIMLGLHKSDDIFKCLGLNERGDHNALEDALMTVEACKRFRLLTNHALGKL